MKREENNTNDGWLVIRNTRPDDNGNGSLMCWKKKQPTYNSTSNDNIPQRERQNEDILGETKLKGISPPEDLTANLWQGVEGKRENTEVYDIYTEPVWGGETS